MRRQRVRHACILSLVEIKKEQTFSLFFFVSQNPDDEKPAVQLLYLLLLLLLHSLTHTVILFLLSPSIIIIIRIELSLSLLLSLSSNSVPAAGLTFFSPSLFFNTSSNNNAEAQTWGRRVSRVCSLSSHSVTWNEWICKVWSDAWTEKKQELKGRQSEWVNVLSSCTHITYSIQHTRSPILWFQSRNSSLFSLLSFTTRLVSVPHVFLHNKQIARLFWE